jgi:phage tail sheath protein FI
VNIIRAFSGPRGIRVWGARTASSDLQWRFVNVRRIFILLRKVIQVGTQWVVFEPNSHSLWKTMTRMVSNFLSELWVKGYLRGGSPEEAFYVKCDEETNTPELRDSGHLVVEIGCAPVRPAEFIVFRISHRLEVQSGEVT